MRLTQRLIPWLFTISTLALANSHDTNGTNSISLVNSFRSLFDVGCQAVNLLVGPVGYLAVVGFFAWGAISILGGRRGGVGFLVTAIVVATVIAFGPDFLRSFFDAFNTSLSSIPSCTTLIGGQ